MKKNYLIRGILMCLCLLTGIKGSAYDAEIDGIYYNFISESDAEVTYEYYYYSSYYFGDVTIPASITYNGKTYSVTSIGNEAFKGRGGLTSVTIPNSVTSIGNEAFEDCGGLTSVTIPNSVTSIGNEAFSGCSGLTSVTIGNGVTSIVDYAFYGCSGLTSITIPNSVTSIGIFAFSGCSSLTSVTIPNSVTSIGDGAFEYCSGLTSVTIPNSVTSIGDGAFGYCSGLTSVTIPNSVTSIYGAFYGCSSLTSVTVEEGNAVYDSRDNCNAIIETATNTLIIGCQNTIIPNSVTSIRDGAFSLCTGLTSITIPNSVTNIGNYAFFGCSGLTSVTIPNSVTSIGWNAFHSCRSLTSITIPESVTIIGEGAFYGCYVTAESFINNTSLTDIYYWSPSICDEETNDGLLLQSFYDDYYVVACRPWATSITIPEDVTTIGQSAFEGCSSLTSITIGSGVKSVEARAFLECNALEQVHITDLAAWCNISFSNYYQDTYYDYAYYSQPLYYAHHLYLNGQEVKDLVIPEGVTSISDYVFSDCSNLTSVTIPSSVTSIGSNTFSNCKALEAVHITDLAAWCNISFDNRICNPLVYVHHLYMNGQEVKDLVIPEGVTSIGDYVFNECSNLTSVTIPSSVTSIGNEAFCLCRGIKEIYCYAEETPEVKSSYEGSFYGVDVSKVLLVVPDEAVEKYKAHEVWGQFMIETPTGLEAIHNPQFIIQNEDTIYNLDGQRVSALQRGINIIRRNDGTAKKVLKR